MLRLRPAADLLARVSLSADTPSVAHLGCGDGAVSQLLRQRWMRASLRCSGFSDAALMKARERVARPAEFVLESVDEFVSSRNHDSYDVVFIDGALQNAKCVPVLERLLEQVRPGGALAAHFPLHSNKDSPSGHALFWQAAKECDALDKLGLAENASSIDVAECMSVLSGPLCSELDIWSSTYTTAVQTGHTQGLVSLLGLERAVARQVQSVFEREIEKHCPKQPNGSRLLEMSYAFVVAKRPDLMDIYTDYAAYHDHQLTKGWKS